MEIATARSELARAVLNEPVIGAEANGLTGAGPDGDAAEEETANAGADGDAQGAKTVTAGGDETLMVALTPVELAEDREQVSAAGLAVLRGLAAEGAVEMAATLERSGRAGELTVPAAAVVTAPGGNQCVLIVTSAALRPVAIEILGDDEDGGALVRGELRAGDEVRLSPPAKDRRCA
jgi:hypothetical protein